MEQDVFFYGYTAYITFKFLIDRGVPPSTIYNNTSNKAPADKKWFTSSMPNNKKNKLIAYDSIPYIIISKYKLPDYNELREIESLTAQKIKESKQVNVSRFVKSSLDLDYYKWEELKCIYGNELLSDDKLEMFCKSHAVLSKIIELNNYGYKLKELFDAYCQYDDLIFITDNYKSFCNKLYKLKKSDSFIDVLVHGLNSMPSNNLKKTEDVLIEIKRLYYNGKKPTASTILQEVNEFLIRSNRKTISISSIYNVIAQYFIKNEASIARHGVKYVEDNLLPYLHFNLPANEDILWLMDGSRFQFAYKSNTNKFNFLVFFIIIDAYNKRIVGYSSDDSENGCMVKKALEMACKKSYSLPREIISDNSSAFKSDDLIKFKGRSKLLGLNWRFIRRQNPRDNAIAERFFGVFQESFCKRYDGYLGDGIKSKYIDGKPSPEEIKKYLSTRSLRSKEELISLLDEIITRYNNSIQRKKSLESDAMNIKYLYNIDPKSQRRFEPIKIDTIKYSELFWPSKAITVKHGEIYFEIDKEAFIYQIYDENLLLKLHGNKVLVRYYPGDMSQILVFDFQTDKYLVTLKRYVNIPKAAIERDEDDNKALFKYSGKSKELKKKLLMRIEKVYEMSEKNRDNLPPKLLEFNIGTKAEKEEIESSVMNEELKKISGFENSEVFSEVIDYDYLFKNLYAKKGSLNIFNNGNS